jgi:hypothetical protein
MGNYRHKTTGEVKSQGEWRALNKNVSFPKVWTQATLDALQLDPVFETPQPTLGKYQLAIRNGVEKDSKGNWVTAWLVKDMFDDYTNENGEVHTKSEQEAEYQFGLDLQVRESVRNHRNSLLAKTDWMALSDVTMTPEMAAYRQALRDITQHPNFPNLSEEDWPVKP